MARRSKENAIDWDAIEKAYRLGNKSNKQLAAEFGVDAGFIGKKARAGGWVVDKSKEVEAVTNSLLIQSASGIPNPNSTPSALEVKAAGQANFDVIMGHRVGLARMASVKDKLLGNIESAVDGMQSVDEILAFVREAATDDESAGKAMDMLRKVAGRGALVDDLKKLAEIDEKVRKGQREAFGIDKEGDKPSFEYEAILRRVHAAKR